MGKKRPRAEVRTFDEIEKGSTFGFTHEVLPEDIERFAELSGDFNPLHTDEAFAAGTPFKRPIAHGMLVASLFSRLVGMHCPGRDCLYLSQTLQFKKPVVAGDTIEVRGAVIEKSDATRMLTIRTTASVGGVIVVEGIARVQVRGGRNP